MWGRSDNLRGCSRQAAHRESWGVAVAKTGKSAKDPTPKKRDSTKSDPKKADSKKAKPNQADRDEGEDESSSSRIWAVLAAVAIVALAVVLIVTSQSGPTAGPASSSTGSVAGASSSPPSTGSPSASASVGPSEASVCGLTDIAMSGTVTEAPQATWSMIGAMAAPSIKGEGPGLTDTDGYPSCFARTPLGALVAASTYLAMGSYDPWRRKYYERAMMPGRGQEVLLSQPEGPAESPNGIQVQISGFYVVSYNGQMAEIDLGLLASDGSEGAKLMSLQWSGGDWKVRLSDDGKELSPLREKHPEDQFIPWSAGV